MNQSELWAGTLGNAYTNENNNEGYFSKRMSVFSSILLSCPIDTSVLEVGCNRGHNLKVMTALRNGFQEIGVPANWTFSGLEINRTAAEYASQYAPILNQSLLLPIPGKFDLVFSVGVLSHVETSDLQLALDNVVGATRYRLVIAEYYGTIEKEYQYRNNGKLFRRPWDRLLEKYPLRLIDSYYLNRDIGFDNLHFWYMELNKDADH